MREVRTLALSVGLLLLIWGVWLHGVGIFPPFVDETVHIHMAELNLQNASILEGINLGRQFTIWWYALFQPAASSPMWVARTATLLAFLPGVAGVLALARRAAGRWAQLFAALLLLFSAYHLFFTRLALADTVAGGMVLLALAIAYRLQDRASVRDAVLVGLLLFLAAGAKINTLPFFGMPLAAALTLRPKGRSWSLQLRWLGTALGTAIGLLAVFLVALRLRGLDFLNNSLSLAVSGRGSVDLNTVFDLVRISGNARGIADVLAVYLGSGALVLLLFGLALLLMVRPLRGTGAYLLLCMFGPALVFWINLPQETRFYVVLVALLLLSGAIALARLFQHQSILIRYAALGLVLLWGVVQWFPFARAAASDPATMPLPERDAAQYVLSDASGFGMAEVYQTLRASSVTSLIGLVANCQGLRYSLPTAFPITCPTMGPNGEDRETLTTLMNDSRQPGVYVVLEAIPYAPSTAPGVPVAVIEHPPGRVPLTIYDLSPQP